MPGCVFHASGEDFCVEAFLADSSLRPYQVYHKGEFWSGSRQFRKNGLKFDVSEADGDLKAQIEDAIRFLASHETELQRLRDFPGVTDMRLDFGLCRRDVAAQFHYLPPKLISLAGELSVGIELSIYAASDPPSRPA